MKSVEIHSIYPINSIDLNVNEKSQAKSKGQVLIDFLLFFFFKKYIFLNVSRINQNIDLNIDMVYENGS